MFEKFLSNGWREFHQRYEGSYGFFKGTNGKKMLARLEGIQQGACHFVDSRGVTYTVYPDSDDDIGFEFFPPKAQYYNTKDGSAYLVQRVAQRQFQRGLTGKNTRLYVLGSYGHVAMDLGFQSLEQIYLKQVTPQEAFANREKRPGVALSGQLGWSAATTSLYLYDKLIGTMKENMGRFIVNLNEPTLWRTEVSDALRSLGVNYEVH